MGVLKDEAYENRKLRFLRKEKSSFFKKGVFLAILSGISYGLNSAFLVLAESWAVWNDFWALPLAATLIGYCLICAVGTSINDTISGIWCLIIAAVKGKLGDFFSSLKSRPGGMMVLAALAGGPIAATCSIVGLMMAGGIAAPITALCSAVGAILGRILYKQKLNLRMICGIIICFIAAVILGGTTLNDISGNGTLGIIIAFIAAVAWGFEGCIAGYGTSMMDYEIGITIRQLVSGLSNLIIVVPILCVIAAHTINMSGIHGNPFSYFYSNAVFGIGILWFVVSGFFAVFAYSLWYKGNSMCGAALGMTCNALYSFWVPFFCMIICGWIMGMDGYVLTPIQWIMAVVEVFGIWLIAMNPLDLLKKREV